mmetsp:Transcript_50923/g.146988  ORF Transcript_50923/g.146988 Transcript_50923/m.146988 type:complete len:456 (+) Transcript_50923:132-1499(+)
MFSSAAQAFTTGRSARQMTFGSRSAETARSPTNRKRPASFRAITCSSAGAPRSCDCCPKRWKIASTRVSGADCGGRRNGAASSFDRPCFTIAPFLRWRRRPSGINSCMSSSVSMWAARYADSNKRFSTLVRPSMVARTVATAASTVAELLSCKSPDMSQRPSRCCTSASIRSCNVAMLAPNAAGSQTTSLPIHRSSCKLKPTKGAANFMSPLLHKDRNSSFEGRITASSLGLPTKTVEQRARKSKASASASVYEGKATCGGSLHGAAPAKLSGSRPTKSSVSCRPRRSTSGIDKRISTTPAPSLDNSWEWSKTTTTLSEVGGQLPGDPRSLQTSASAARRSKRSSGRRIAASKRSTARSMRPEGMRCWSSLPLADCACSVAAAAECLSSSASRACSSPREEKQAQFSRTCLMPSSRRKPKTTSVFPVPAGPQACSAGDAAGRVAPSPSNVHKPRT